jgi:MFS transporter, FHS family, glucose/mannose:H+ symporter
MLERVTHPDSNPTLNPRVVAATFLGLALIGAITASLGPALGTIRTQFRLTDFTLGFLASAQFAGAVLGNLSFVPLSQVPAGWRMAGGMVAFGLGALGVAFAVSFPLVLLSFFVMGAGFGTFQVNYANVFARGFGARSGALVTLMGGAFALGSILGPLAVGLLLERSLGYGPLFAGVAALAALLPFALHSVRAHAPVTVRPGQARVSSLPLVLSFAAFAVFYVAAEGSVGLWSPSHLSDGLGFSSERAAFSTSIFWVAITVGRFASIPLSLRVSSPDLIVGALALGLVGLTIAHVPALAPYGYWLTGLAFAPVFPNGLAWLGRAVPSEGATSAYFLAGTLGSLLSAPLVGRVKEEYGANAIPSILLAFTVVALACAVWLRRSNRSGQPSKLERSELELNRKLGSER